MKFKTNYVSLSEVEKLLSTLQKKGYNVTFTDFSKFMFDKTTKINAKGELEFKSSDLEKFYSKFKK